ncbi:MAG: CBS domain-containing protein [Bacteroidales bacterium]|nr:CBS domain-containing protein [Bacteroidales bacterium]
MTVFFISLFILGALGMIFFSGVRVALSVCDRLVFEIDIKNKAVRQGVAFRPGDNPRLCITLMHTGEIVSECMLGIAAWHVAGLFYVDSPIARLGICAAFVMVSLLLLKAVPSAIFATHSNQALRTFSLMASVVSNFIYPWLYVVMFPIVSRANRRGENKFYELIPFADNPMPSNKAAFRNNDFRILHKALDFTNIKIRECLVPRNEIVFADRSDSIETLTKKFTGSEFSKVLICDKSIDKVVGYVNAISLFKNPASIDKILTDVIVAPETMTADKLFKQFIKRRRSVAIVIDEYGGTAGMLTIEDIIEEITGEIEDEHDIQELMEKQISPCEFEFSGRLEIDYINDKYKLELPKSDEYETLAGYILKINEDFPEPMQKIDSGAFHFEILQVKRPRIILVRLRVSHEYSKDNNTKK